jgi:rhamnosyltransferase subunit B
VFRAFAAGVPAYLAALERVIVREERTTLISSGAVFAARMLRELRGLPQVVVHLQPAVYLSEYDMPTYVQGTAGLMRWLPRWMKRLLMAMPNPLDSAAMPGVRCACETLGLRAPRSVWREWWHSPDGNVALFPDWFAPAQADWPGPLFQHTFPLEDLGQDQPLGESLLAFLAAGPAPVVFTLGTGNQHARRFFEVALSAVNSLGLRAVFATRYPKECLPLELPEHVLAVEYAPFSKLLHHASALVSHGGVGTASQAMAAGIPHLIMALAHDQPDNAERLRRLGIGRGMAPWAFTKGRLERWLLEQQVDAELPGRLSQVQGWVRERPGMDVLCEWLEARTFAGAV